MYVNISVCVFYCKVISNWNRSGASFYELFNVSSECCLRLKNSRYSTLSSNKSDL